jgi:hypothetical protein
MSGVRKLANGTISTIDYDSINGTVEGVSSHIPNWKGPDLGFTVTFNESGGCTFTWRLGYILSDGETVNYCYEDASYDTSTGAFTWYANRLAYINNGQIIHIYNRATPEEYTTRNGNNVTTRYDAYDSDVAEDGAHFIIYNSITYENGGYQDTWAIGGVRGENVKSADGSYSNKIYYSNGTYTVKKYDASTGITESIFCNATGGYQCNWTAGDGICGEYDMYADGSYTDTRNEAGGGIVIQLRDKFKYRDAWRWNTQRENLRRAA